MYKNKLLFALFLVVVSFPAFAADLLQIYKEALQNDPVFAGARAAYIAGQEKSVQGRALLLPNVNITGRSMLTNANYYSGDVAVDGKRSTSGSYSLQLIQPLFRWENWQLFEQSKLQVLASEAQLGQAQLELMVRVAQAYFDVLSAQDALESVRANKTAITEQLDFAKQSFDVGTTTITDQQEAQARFDLAVAQEFAAENELEIKRYTLQQIIGKPPVALVPLHKEVPLTAPKPANMNEWVIAAEQNNFNVVGAQFNQEIAKRAISVNRAGHLPTLDLVASVTRSNTSAIPVQQLPSYTENSRNIGIQLTVPVFSGFAVNSKVREAIALEDKAGNDLEAAKRSAALSARQAFLGVNIGLAQINAYKAAETSSQLALQSNKLGYEVGIRINIDVLNAQQQLYTTQQNLAKARYDTIMNGLRLKLASGSLKEEDLVQVNGLLY
jgi:outer membrane protein